MIDDYTTKKPAITNCIHVNCIIKYQCKQLLSISMMRMIVNNSVNSGLVNYSKKLMLKNVNSANIRQCY